MAGIIIRTAAFAIFLVATALGSAPAQERRQHRPGQFDFYVLALSWSPSFCKDREESGREAREQCGARPYSFVVHGLWPQYENGFPRACQVPAPRLNRNIMASMLDLMPAPRLVYNQWDNHGTCSGLPPQAYFDLVRKARLAVTVPENFSAPTTALTVTPHDIEEAFVKANPGLSSAGIAVTCGSTRLGEVRICMTKELRFRDCAEVDRRACRRDKLIMPPVRGG